MAHLLLWLDKNDHSLRVKNLKNKDTKLYINSGAVVQVTKIVDSAGATLTGIGFPVALAPDPGTTTGEWKCVLGADLATVVGAGCKGLIEVNPGGSPRGYEWAVIEVVERRA
jgi:hypothetical protein